MPTAARLAKHVPLDHAQLAKLESRLHAKLAAGESTAYDAGLLFDELARRDGHHTAKFTSLEAYADARFPTVGYRTLRRYRRVATHFERASVLKHGVAKLDLGLSYLETTAAPDHPRDLFSHRIVLADGTTTPFAKATLRQLEAAVAHALSAAHQPVRGAKALTERIRHAAHVLSHTLPKGTPPPRLASRLVGAGAKKRALVSIHDLDLRLAPAVLRTLARALTESE